MAFRLGEFVPDPAQQDYLNAQMDKVSRSFALVVPFVEPPARYFLAIAYLLCRVVDNIEDACHIDGSKQAWFADFARLLSAPGQAAEVLSRWESAPWPCLTDDEQHLMCVTGGLPLWQLYGAIPARVREVIRHWVGAMAEGMRQLSDGAERPRLIRVEGIDVLAKVADYDDYCYYVAGTVGHMASEIVIMQYGLSEDVGQTLKAHAADCGRSLQKTNILKDFAEDLGRGVCYFPDEWLGQANYKPLRLQGAPMPWQRMVFDDVLGDLREATEYLLALPHTAAGYRRASLLCLLPAYQTLMLAADRRNTLFTPQHLVKISRSTMAGCMLDSEALLHDNEGIRKYSQRIEDLIRARLSE